MVERKKRRKLEIAKRPSESAVAEEAASIVSDDVLVEILVRLRDYRTVIRCGLVCKLWSSLIFNSENYFSRSFNHHHLRLGPSNDSLPYTLLMRGLHSSCTFESLRRLNLPACYDLFCEKSQALHGNNRQLSPWFWPDNNSNYLNFLGSPNPVIRCSFQDLLFVQISSTQFCICNPLTKQFVKLPETPLFLKLNQIARWGFACKPNCSCCLQPSSYCNCSIKYKVVLINPDEEDRLSYRMAIFSSETGQWKELIFPFPLLREETSHWYETPVACNNGILYWEIVSEVSWIKRILSFDPFKETEVEAKRFRFISFPAGFNYRGIYGIQLCGRERLEVVRGRLRLAQCFYYEYKPGTFYLKAWELNEEEDAGWVLVHDVVVEMKERGMMYLIGLHPDDGDVFFFFRHGYYCKDTNPKKDDAGLCKYQIGKDSFEKIRDTIDRRQWFSRSIELFTLVHPLLPTKIPALLCPNN